MQDVSLPPILPHRDNVNRDIFAVIIEISFLLIIFCISLIALNYFNILHLSDSFSFLSFLPHEKQNVTYIFPTPQPTIVQRAAIITPVAYGAAEENAAKVTLQNFVEKITAKQMLPSSFSFVVSQSGNMHVFTTTWNNNHIFYLGSLLEGYQGNPSIIRRLSLFIQPDPASTQRETIPTQARAQQLLPQFFPMVTSTMHFTCSQTVVQNVKTPYCISSFSTAREKLSFGIFNTNRSVVHIFACELPHDSPYFNSSNPCIVDN